MSARTFIDSNVLIYAHDIEAGAKHRVASSLLRELWPESRGALSTQVLQEFYVNATRKIPVPLSRDEARRVVVSYQPWCFEATSAADVLKATEIEQRYRVSFWDGLIIALAAKCQAVCRRT